MAHGEESEKNICGSVPTIGWGEEEREKTKFLVSGEIVPSICWPQTNRI